MLTGLVRENARGGQTPLATALSVTVINGDLSFLEQPILIGHYHSSKLTGAERVMDVLVGGTMSQALRMGAYPDAIGSHQVFLNGRRDPDNPWRVPRPKAVIVAGLGNEGELKPEHLAETVRLAALAWAQRLAEEPDRRQLQFTLAATLLGSGGIGISAGQAAQLIAQGVYEANVQLDAGPWPRVAELQLIELYLDRAADALRALHLYREASPDRYCVEEFVKTGVGGFLRPLDSGYRGADYDFISATTHEQGGETAVVYSLNTHRARSEIRAQTTQVELVREIVRQSAGKEHADGAISNTLFRLLVPLEMVPYMQGTTDLVMELDGGTAAIPWELLDASEGRTKDPRPWAIRTKLIRKLRSANFRAQLIDAGTEASALVIGEPECDARVYPRLDGARAEARAVATLLSAEGALGPDKVKALISPEGADVFGPDAGTVTDAVMAGGWRIVHITGHGEPPKGTKPRGVVLSGGTFLGPNEIKAMPVVPELVFVNCCHLGSRDARQILNRKADQGGVWQNPAQFAASVAQALIEVGVRCVIAAGWAVEDGPAETFAREFYRSLLEKHRFIEAVATAREAACKEGGNTWAAYQCYGDPDWTLTKTRMFTPRLVDELFSGIRSQEGLRIALQTVATESNYQKAPASEQRKKIEHLENRFAAVWGGDGGIAEAFGRAWDSIADVERAVWWYERAWAADDGRAPIRVGEQLANLWARAAWEEVNAARSSSSEDASPGDGEHHRNHTKGSKQKTSGSPDRSTANTSLQAAAEKGRAAVTRARDLLHTLIGLQETGERQALLGSVYKRLALIEGAAGETAREADAFKQMQVHYDRAVAIGRERHPPNFYYPGLNSLTAELMLGMEDPAPTKLALYEELKQQLNAINAHEPDFFTIVGDIELRLYTAIAERALAKKLAALQAEYAEHYQRVTAIRKWKSVRDQLQFVLPRYAARASAQEAGAAQALLSFVEHLISPSI